jgi:hypothetical protein
MNQGSIRRRFFLDANIYDRLETDDNTRGHIRRLVDGNSIEVVASPVVVAELRASPFKGIPEWFRVSVLPEGIAIAGIARSGMARASAGVVFKQHLGESRKGADAIIAHSANSMQAVLVSEDRRCRERLKSLSDPAHAMDYDEFRKFIEEHASE